MAVREETMYLMIPADGALTLVFSLGLRRGELAERFAHKTTELTQIGIRSFKNRVTVVLSRQVWGGLPRVINISTS